MTARALADARAGWISALLLGAWYAATAARGLMWFDTGEFALVAGAGGVSHPPGQPLYTWLSQAAYGLGGLVGLNLLSAFAAALCAVPSDALLRRLTDLGATGRALALLCVGVLAPVWDQATRIELYAPAALLSLTTVAAGLAVVDDDRGPRAWLGLGLGVGLLACLNAIFAVGTALAVGGYGALVLRRAPRRLLAAGLAAAVGAVAGLLPYAQIALSHSDPSRFVWGDFDTAQGWLDFLRGRDYGHTAHAAWGRVPAHGGVWLGWLLGEGSAPTVLLGALGWLADARLRRRLWLPGALVFAGVAFTFTYGSYQPQVPDYNGYFLPALWLGAVGLAGLAGRARRGMGLGLLTAALVAGGLTGARPLPLQRDRSGLQGAEQLAQAWLDATPPDGVLLVESDHLVFPLMYLQEVKGARPDLLLINVGFAASGWYWRHLYARHPALPKIPLAAPSTAARLDRLLRALPGRPVRVEHLGLAAGLRRAACLDGWGLRLAPCDPAADRPEALPALLSRLWRREGHDLITPHVLAGLALARAQAAWALDRPEQAVAALAAGAPPGKTPPPVADAAAGQAALGPRPLPSPAPGTLIGDPAHNRALYEALTGTRWPE
ncbi:MAG: DUF2723 domain-containing protein [Myxococcales bacterium]|nr:DUF2723 domain-containing protein [Myxococcales bacterium]